jgi:hypothetical protein
MAPMFIYRISPSTAQAERSKNLKRSAILTAVSMLVGFLIGGRSFFTKIDPIVLIAVISFFGALFTFTIWRSLRKTSKFLKEAYTSFEIAVDEQAFTKKQKDTPDLTLARSEIRSIEELRGKGFRICTEDTSRNIWVPSELDGYEELKADVLAIPGVKEVSKSAAWLRSYVLIAALLLLIALSILSGNKWVVVLSNSSLSIYLLAVLVKQYRNPNLTARTRRKLLWVFLIGGLCFFVRAIFAWRG